MKLYVKKIWTLNPTGYKYVPLEKALTQYDEWLKNLVKLYNYQNYKHHKIRYKEFIKTPPKSFEEWLKTEI